MHKDLMFSSKSDEWETPKEVFNKFNSIFNFELDAASTIENKLCPNYYTLEDDSLKQDWSKFETVWCNPPYGRKIGKFIEKGYVTSKTGTIVCFLIPSRTDTKWWYEYCSKGYVIFIKGRLKFVNRTFPSWNKEGNFKILPAPFPSAIVIFDKNTPPKTEYIKI